MHTEQITELSVQTSDTLAQYINIHNSLFKPSLTAFLSQILPIRLFRAYDFEPYANSIKHVEIDIEALRKETQNLLPKLDGFEKQYVHLLLEYQNSLLSAIRLLTKLVEQLIEKSEGGLYSWFEYRRDIKDYKRAEEHYARIGKTLQLKWLSFKSVKDSQSASTTRIKSIGIHPRSQGRKTDAVLADRLMLMAPRSFEKAQDVLLATEKWIAGPGWFTSQGSLMEGLQQEVYSLRRALEEDGYGAELGLSPLELVMSFFNEWSDAFPNWQQEYAALNNFIPLCLDGF